MSTNAFHTSLDAYLEHIRQDYSSWGNRNTDMSDPIKAQVRADMIANFNSKLTTVRGSKYIKVVSDTGVHTFIVVKPDARFQIGDILKAASWAAPARNFARGNIFNPTHPGVTWTGAA